MRHQGVNSDGEPISSAFVEKDDSNRDFGLDCSNLPSLTRQEFAEEADINNLMARYEATGLLPSNMNTAAPRYLDVSDVPDMRTALDSLANATAAFMALPASVRREFDNDAVKFVEFCQDPENVPQLRTWGLAEPEALPTPPQRVEIVGGLPGASEEPAQPRSSEAPGSKSKK